MPAFAGVDVPEKLLALVSRYALQSDAIWATPVQVTILDAVARSLTHNPFGLLFILGKPAASEEGLELEDPIHSLLPCPRIRDLRKASVTGTVVRVEFITRCIAPLQDHRREIWRHRAGDDLRLHVSELNADSWEEVIRAFFSSAAIPAIPRTVLPIYNLGAREASRVTVGILKFNAWGPFLADGIMPGPLPSAPAASSEQDSVARGMGPTASGDFDDDDAESGERLVRRRHPEGTVVLSDSSDDGSALSDQPTEGDVDASSSRALEKEGRQARLEAERRSKFNDECTSQQPEARASHGKKPAGESSAPPPPPSALPSKRGWVERDAS
jgi:hypothetical protein